MTVEQYVNNFETTLGEIIDDSVTSFDLTDASGLPSTGNFRLLIDQEIVLVSSRSSNTVTVTRAIDGTSAAAHNSGVSVKAILTKGSIDQVRKDIIQSGDYASLPAAGLAGRLYLPTDAPILLRDDGSSWQKFGPIAKINRPTSSLLSSLTWVNQGSTTATYNAGGIDIAVPNSASTWDWRMLVKTAPATPWTLTVAFLGVWDTAGSFCHIGPVFREGSGGSNPGRITAHAEGSNTGITVPNYTRIYRNFADPNTTGTSAYVLEDGVSRLGGPLSWMRITDDGTNLVAYISPDGVFWSERFSVTRTDYTTPTEFGFGLNNNGGTTLKSRLLHWEET